MSRLPGPDDRLSSPLRVACRVVLVAVPGKRSERSLWSLKTVQIAMRNGVRATGGLLAGHAELSAANIVDPRIYDVSVQMLLEHSASLSALSREGRKRAGQAARVS